MGLVKNGLSADFGSGGVQTGFKSVGHCARISDTIDDVPYIGRTAKSDYILNLSFLSLPISIDVIVVEM